MKKFPISNFQFPSSERGQLSLEILIAIGILATSLSAMFIVIYGSQSISVDSQEANRAVNLARETIENTLASSSGSFGSLVSGSSTQGEFLKEIIVQNVDMNTKRVTSKISWQTDYPLRTQSVELTTLVTDWQLYQDLGGDTGGGGLSGDWQHPQTLGSIDLGPGNSATGLDVLNKIIYLSATASDSKKPDFFVVDATNGQSPYVVSSINTGPGLNAVDVAGGYAYVANNDDDSQLQIISIANISSPLLISSFKLQNVSGSGAVGQSIFYYNSKVYIGTKSATGSEFHIVDVSNPNNPTELGSFAVDADVNGIYVSGNLAYLATSNDAKELLILDVSNPAQITQAGVFDAAGADDGKSIYVSGTTAYLGRASGNSDFMLIDVSNPSSPQLVGSADLGGVSVNGIRTRDYLAFLATSDSNREFQVWNISNPSVPIIWSSYNFPQVGSGIDYESNIVYVSVRSNDALRIITSGP